MSLRDLIEELASGFVARIGERVGPQPDSGPANAAARKIGRDIADALLAELHGEAPDDAHQQTVSLQGDRVMAQRHPCFTEEEIHSQRMASWNPVFNVTPELQQALQDYQARYLAPSRNA